jgi:hypothetical protein
MSKSGFKDDEVLIKLIVGVVFYINITIIILIFNTVIILLIINNIKVLAFIFLLTIKVLVTAHRLSAPPLALVLVLVY